MEYFPSVKCFRKNQVLSQYTNIILLKYVDLLYTFSRCESNIINATKQKFYANILI